MMDKEARQRYYRTYVHQHRALGYIARRFLGHGRRPRVLFRDPRAAGRIQHEPARERLALGDLPHHGIPGHVGAPGKRCERNGIILCGNA